MFYRPGGGEEGSVSLLKPSFKTHSVLLFKFSFRNVKCYYLLFYSFPFSFLMSNVDVRKYNGSYLSCSYAPVQ